MKHLYLVRHAKSSWELDFPDIERTLNERGYRDAHLVGKYLSENIDHRPDAVVCSPSVRTYTTALIFLPYLKFPVGKLMLARNLYESGPEDYLNTISETSDEIKTLMLFGHNPTISELTNRLTGRNSESLGTTNVAEITLAISSWEKIKAGYGKLLRVIDPKEIQD